MNQCAQVQQDLPAWRRSTTDEFANAMTHGFGLLIAFAGALIMLPDVLANGDSRLIFSSGLYLASLVAVYAMSTLSHMATSVRWKSLFRKYDQAFIYLLIVATYTPFSLVYLNGIGWTAMLAVMWVVALAGFVAKTIFAHRVETVSIASYVVLGWMPIVALPEIWRSAPSGAFDLIIAGGACYMAGTLFLVNDELVRYFHAAWHVLVIAGSACHFVAIFGFIA
jgi:hemolysin III